MTVMRLPERKVPLLYIWIQPYRVFLQCRSVRVVCTVHRSHGRTVWTTRNLTISRSAQQVTAESESEPALVWLLFPLSSPSLPISHHSTPSPFPFRRSGLFCDRSSALCISPRNSSSPQTPAIQADYRSLIACDRNPSKGWISRPRPSGNKEDWITADSLEDWQGSTNKTGPTRL